MRELELRQLQRLEFNSNKLCSLLERHPAIANAFAMKPELATSSPAINLTFLLHDKNFLNSEPGNINLASELALFLFRTPNETLFGVSSLCTIFSEFNKLTLRHLDFILKLENMNALYNFTYLLGYFCKLGFLTEDSIDTFFFSLTNGALLDTVCEIFTLLFAHFSDDSQKKYWEVMMPAFAIEKESSTLFLAILQQFEKQNELREGNCDQFFLEFESAMDEPNVNKETILKELASVFLQVFNCYFWGADRVLCQKILAYRSAVDILFQAGLSASVFVTMSPAVQDYYLILVLNSTYYKEASANHNVAPFNLNLLRAFFKKYSDFFFEEIIHVLYLPSQKEMILFYNISCTAEALGFLNKEIFHRYMGALLSNQFLSHLQFVCDIVIKLNLTQGSLQEFWKIMIDPRFIDPRVPNSLRHIFIALNDINELTKERVAALFQELVINPQETVEDLLRVLEMKLQDIRSFSLDGIDVELADKLNDNKAEFYKLCKTGLSYSEFIVLEPSLQDKLLSDECGYADAILTLHERNLFPIDHVLELYRYDSAVCDALLCAPEEPMYHELARDTLMTCRNAESAWRMHLSIQQSQNQFSFLATSVSVQQSESSDQVDKPFQNCDLS